MWWEGSAQTNSEWPWAESGAFSPMHEIKVLWADSFGLKTPIAYMLIRPTISQFKNFEVMSTKKLRDIEPLRTTSVVIGLNTFLINTIWLNRERLQ